LIYELQIALYVYGIFSIVSLYYENVKPRAFHLFISILYFISLICNISYLYGIGKISLTMFSVNCFISEFLFGAMFALCVWKNEYMRNKYFKAIDNLKVE
jgi:hypothetical protein